MGGLKISVKLEQEDGQDRRNHSSFAPLFHLYLLEGPLFSFWSSLGLLSVCMNMALREKKGLAVHLPTHLGYEEMGAFLLLLEIWAMVTQNGEHDPNLFSHK